MYICIVLTCIYVVLTSRYDTGFALPFIYIFCISGSDVVTGVKPGFIYMSRYDRHGSEPRAGKLPSAKVLKTEWSSCSASVVVELLKRIHDIIQLTLVSLLTWHRADLPAQS